MKKLRIELPIIYNCNVNCRYCNHFCGVIKEHGIENLDTFKKDCEYLAKIVDKDSKHLYIFSGGEPLLNPDLIKYIELFAEIFKKANKNYELEIQTNGFIIKRMEDSFWKTLGKYNVVLNISRYPMRLDTNLINKKCNEYNITLKYKNPDDIGYSKPMHKVLIDKEASIDSQKRFSTCKDALINIREGKLFKCPIAPNIHLLQSEFEQELTLEEGKDYLYLDKITSEEDITNFTSIPCTICKYHANEFANNEDIWMPFTDIKDYFMKPKEETFSPSEIDFIDMG